MWPSPPSDDLCNGAHHPLDFFAVECSAAPIPGADTCGLELLNSASVECPEDASAQAEPFQPSEVEGGVEMIPTTVMSSTNFMPMLELFVAMQSWLYSEYRERSQYTSCTGSKVPGRRKQIKSFATFKALADNWGQSNEAPVIKRGYACGLWLRDGSGYEADRDSVEEGLKMSERSSQLIPTLTILLGMPSGPAAVSLGRRCCLPQSEHKTCSSRRDTGVCWLSLCSPLWCSVPATCCGCLP